MKNKKHSKLADRTQASSANTLRRRALKSILVSGGIVTGSSALPKSWSRPIIDSVILPSHAATTDDSGSLPGEGTTPVPTINYFFSQDAYALNDSGSGGTLFAERVLDTLIPTANALVFTTSIVYACISITGTTYTARVVRMVGKDFADYNNLSGTVGSSQNLPDPIPYGFCNASIVESATILIDNVSPTSCHCSISGNGTTDIETVDAGPCSDPFIGECQD